MQLGIYVHIMGKRCNFASIQLSHQLPTKEGSSFRMRTGYERMMAHRASKLYAYAAKEDGVVIEVNEKSKMCKVQYKDGSIDVFTYGEEYGICSDIITTQKQELTVSVGDKFKKNDILCYNPQFFEKDPYTNQVDWKHGVAANVGFLEVNGTYEDSSTITQEFGKKLAIEPVQQRVITLTKDMFVHDYKHIGDEVDVNDPLMIFENSQINDLSSMSKDNDALEYLARLNRTTPKAKYTGIIVKIEILTGCDPSELHPTLKKIYNEATALRRERHKFTIGINTEYEYPEVKPIVKGTKAKGIKFEDDTVVVKYWIKETLVAGIGDKIVVDSSLKSVVSDVLDVAITTESGVPIDVEFSGNSVAHRILCSPLIIGIGERVLEELEKQIVEDWKK